MRFLRIALAAATLVATAAIASPADPKSGAEFTTLAAPQPTQAVGKKVEVIEFFAYHCPACNVMEPHVAEWIKKHAGDVTFRRIAFPFKGPADPEAHLWATLDAMGKADEVGPKAFRANHVERLRLNTDEAILDWVGKGGGLDKAKFLEYWNSFGVLTKLRRLPALVGGYKIDGTPSFVVDGRYLTSPSQIGAANPALENQLPEATKTLLDALVAKVLKEKGVQPAAAPAKAAAASAKAATAPAKTAAKK